MPMRCHISISTCQAVLSDGGYSRQGIHNCWPEANLSLANGIGNGLKRHQTPEQTTDDEQQYEDQQEGLQDIVFPRMLGDAQAIQEPASNSSGHGLQCRNWFGSEIHAPVSIFTAWTY